MASYSESITPALRGGHEVRSSHGHNSLVTSPTYSGDTGITVWVSERGRELGVFLSPDQIRVIAADWLARADLIDAEGGA